jgi:hypothetical protein
VILFTQITACVILFTQITACVILFTQIMVTELIDFFDIRLPKAVLVIIDNPHPTALSVTLL